MAIVVNMPRLSDTMEEGVVAKWHKKVGDSVMKEISLQRSKPIRQPWSLNPCRDRRVPYYT